LTSILPLTVITNRLKFSKNDALDNSILTISSNAEINISNSVFEENFSFGNGGVIWIENS